MANIWNRPNVGTLAGTHRIVLDKADSGLSSDTVHATVDELTTHIAASVAAGAWGVVAQEWSPVVDTGSNVNISGVSVLQSISIFTPIGASPTHGIVDVQLVATGTPGVAGAVTIAVVPPYAVQLTSSGIGVLNPGASNADLGVITGTASSNLTLSGSAPDTSDVTIFGRLMYVTGTP